MSSTKDYSFLPVQHDKMYEYYQQLSETFWTAGEVDLKNDQNDWLALPENEKLLVKQMLALFAQSDGLITGNIMNSMLKIAEPFKDVVNYYSMQAANETTHNLVYSLMILTYVEDTSEREKLFNASQNYKSIGQLNSWLEEWSDRTDDDLSKIIVFVCMEGIIFSGAFAAIYWFRTENKLEGLCTANEWIARDEGVHTKAGIEFYKILSDHLGKRLSQSDVSSIVEKACKLSDLFMEEALPVSLIGLDSEDMGMYVRCTADYVLELLGYESIYNVENPLEYMALLGASGKTNFFEHVVSEYKRPKPEIGWGASGY